MTKERHELFDVVVDGFPAIVSLTETKCFLKIGWVYSQTATLEEVTAAPIVVPVGALSASLWDDTRSLEYFIACWLDAFRKGINTNKKKMAEKISRKIMETLL